MALTSAQRKIADALINDTFASFGASATGWAPPGTNNGGFVERTQDPNRLPRGTAGLPNPVPGSGVTPQELQAMGGMVLDPRTNTFGYVAPQPTNSAVAAIGGATATPTGTANWMDDPVVAAAYLEQYGTLPGVAPPRPATQAIPASLQAVLAESQKSVMRPARQTIAANALIDGQRGRDNEPGANFMGRTVGSDGVVRAYNQASKRVENVSQNRRPSPSESYKRDMFGNRDMRR